jgi:hypothetical protein
VTGYRPVRNAGIFKIAPSWLPKLPPMMLKGSVSENQSGDSNESFEIFKLSPRSQ